MTVHVSVRSISALLLLSVPHRYVKSNDLIGRTVYEVERVDVGVTLAPELFTLQALTASGGGR